MYGTVGGLGGRVVKMDSRESRFLVGVMSRGEAAFLFHPVSAWGQAYVLGRECQGESDGLGWE